MISPNNQVLLHLSLIEGIGAGSINKILLFLIKKQGLEATLGFVEGRELKASLDRLDLTACYQLDAESWRYVGLSYDQIQLVISGLQSRMHLERELQLLQKYHDIFIVHF